MHWQDHQGDERPPSVSAVTGGGGREKDQSPLVGVGHQMGRKRELLVEVGVHTQAGYLTSAQDAISGAGRA